MARLHARLSLHWESLLQFGLNDDTPASSFDDEPKGNIRGKLDNKMEIREERNRELKRHVDEDHEGRVCRRRQQKVRRLAYFFEEKQRHSDRDFPSCLLFLRASFCSSLSIVISDLRILLTVINDLRIWWSQFTVFKIDDVLWCQSSVCVCVWVNIHTSLLSPGEQQ